jgi:hypothetical protein
MPGDTFFTRINAPHRAAIGNTPGKLRLLLVSERAGAETPPLSSNDLSDLRIFTGARVIYALTAAPVAGAVAQSSMFDYRREGGSRNKHGHFGAPLSSVEVKLVDTATHKTTDDSAKGEVCLASPYQQYHMLTIRLDRRVWRVRGRRRGKTRRRRQIQRRLHDRVCMNIAKIQANINDKITKVLLFLRYSPHVSLTTFHLQISCSRVPWSLH